MNIKEISIENLKEKINLGNFKFYKYAADGIERTAEIDSIEFENYLKNTILRINGFENKSAYSTSKYSARFNLSKVCNVKQGANYLQFEAPLFYKDDARIAVITLSKKSL